MLFVKGSSVNPAILEPKIFPFIDLGFPDLITQLKFKASLTNASLRRFYATSLISLDVTLTFPG
jgi:hypothetical protein